MLAPWCKTPPGLVLYVQQYASSSYTVGNMCITDRRTDTCMVHTVAGKSIVCRWYLERQTYEQVWVKRVRRLAKEVPNRCFTSLCLPNALYPHYPTKLMCVSLHAGWRAGGPVEMHAPPRRCLLWQGLLLQKLLVGNMVGAGALSLMRAAPGQAGIDLDIYSGTQLLVSAMVGVWTLRLGSYLVARIHKQGKDSRFDEVKHQPGTFFVYWSMQVRRGWGCSILDTAHGLQSVVSDQSVGQSVGESVGQSVGCFCLHVCQPFHVTATSAFGGWAQCNSPINQPQLVLQTIIQSSCLQLFFLLRLAGLVGVDHPLPSAHHQHHACRCTPGLV